MKGKDKMIDKNYEDYNCGGFAFGTYEWYFPYDWWQTREDSAFDLFSNGKTAKEIQEIFLEEEFETILEDFKGRIHFIEDWRDASPRDRVICYRNCVCIREENEEEIYVATDYHFKVRINGKWYEKRGEEAPRPCDLDEDSPWVLNSDIIYDSENIYFILDEE